MKTKTLSTSSFSVLSSQILPPWTRPLVISFAWLMFCLCGMADDEKPTYAFERSVNAWREGDPKGAVAQFIHTDWAHFKPLFKAGSILNLTEEKLRAMSQAERDTKMNAVTTEVRVIKELAAAVAKVGREAASQGNPGHAKKCFRSLKSCGEILNTSNHLVLIQMIGRGFVKLSDTEVAKSGLGSP